MEKKKRKQKKTRKQKISIGLHIFDTPSSNNYRVVLYVHFKILKRSLSSAHGSICCPVDPASHLYTMQGERLVILRHSVQEVESVHSCIINLPDSLTHPGCISAEGRGSPGWRLGYRAMFRLLCL